MPPRSGSAPCPGTARAVVRTYQFRFASSWELPEIDEADHLVTRLVTRSGGRGRQSAVRQQRTTETARPPSDVSLYFEFISLAVSAIAATVVSKSTRRLAGISLLAIMNPVHAFTAPYAHRSMHGTCTKPATGSHVRPR